MGGLSGKILLVTGCHSGLGLETARVLSLRGGHVLGAARTAEKATAALAPLGGLTKGFACDLAEPASVRACIPAVKAALRGGKIDALIANAEMANLLFAKELARRFEGTRRTATQCYVAVHPEAAGASGRFFADCNVKNPRADGSDAKTAKKLWSVSEEIVARLS